MSNDMRIRMTKGGVLEHNWKIPMAFGWYWMWAMTALYTGVYFASAAIGWWALVPAALGAWYIPALAMRADGEARTEKILKAHYPGIQALRYNPNI